MCRRMLVVDWGIEFRRGLGLDFGVGVDSG